MSIASPSSFRGPQGLLAVIVQHPARVGAPDGAGRFPLVFLHSDSGRAAQWELVIGALPPERAVVAFDFRGHGGSAPAADGDYSFAGRAADLAAVADALGLGRFVVVAHSAGAAVALQYAADHPERVAGLVLVDPATDPRALPPEVRDGFVRETAGPRALEVTREYYASIAGADAAVRERVLADAAAVHPAARAGVAAAFAAWDPEPTLRAYRRPALVLATSATDAQRTLYHLRPELPHRVIPEVGHWVQLERPAEVAAAIAQFVAEVEAAPAGGVP